MVVNVDTNQKLQIHEVHGWKGLAVPDNYQTPPSACFFFFFLFSFFSRECKQKFTKSNVHLPA
jgi:hypothetical protein